MMPYSHLRLFILSALAILVSACGSSGGSEPAAGSDGSDASVSMAVSANPQPAGDASRKDLSKVEPVMRPGAEAPLDSAPDRISKHAGTRLFGTGFEDGVSLSRTAANSPYQDLVGADSTGYSFPISLGAAAVAQSPSRVIAEVASHSQMAASHFASSELKQVVGRSGGTTKALSLNSKSFGSHAQHISVGSSGLSSDPVVFQRMWIKFDEQTLVRAHANGADRFYQTFWEVKGQAESWLKLKLHYDAAARSLVWAAKGNGLDGDEPSWSDSLTTAPVIMAPASSAAGWHKVEIWLDPDGGRFKVAIDGQTLVDRAGILAGSGSEWIKDFRMMMVSSTVSPLAEVLFDDLEFWDLPPADAFSRVGVQLP